MIDLGLALVFAVGFPLWSIPRYARRRPRLLAGDTAVRQREYRETILWLGGMGIATLAAWWAQGRAPGALGLGVPGTWRFWSTLAVAGTAAGLLALQARAVQRDPRARQTARGALEPVRDFLPVTRRELRLFRAVSLSAGVGEEIFYRGFLIWYLSQFLPLFWAVAVSTLLFGLAHAMHGMGATVRATLSGAVLAALFLFSGALWASMLLHAAIDLSSGETGMAAFGDGGPGGDS